MHVHRGVARKVDVLRHDLSVLGKAADKRVARDELALAVRDGHGEDIPRLDARKPWRLDGSDADAHDARLVTGNIVIGERGAVLVRLDDLAVRHEPEFDERLETVADTAHQPVALLQKAGDRLLDQFAAEERRDELARTVGFVPAREAARDKDDPALPHLGGEFLRRARDFVGGAVADDVDLGLCARVRKRLCRIVFAVGPREDGDEHLGTRRLYITDERARRAAGEILHARRGRCDVAGVYGFQLLLVDLKEIAQQQALVPADDGALRRRFAERRADGHILGKFEHERAVFIAEERFDGDILAVLESRHIAEAHLHDRLGNAAESRRIGGDRLARAQQRRDRTENGEQRRRDGQAVRVVHGLEQHDFMPRALELGRDDFCRLPRRHRKGDEGGRHVDMLEGTAHGVLAADRGDAELHLRLERAQKRRQRLSPALGVVPRF